MSGFTITRDMLVEAAGCDPYELRTDFKNDTDPEAVEALSSIFKNGAEEAADSGSVSQYASNLEERAGTRGSNTIYEDGAAHLEQTYADLGEGGLRSVSTTLGEIKDEMETTRTYLDDIILGGLDVWREWYVRQANSEASTLREDLKTLAPEDVYTWRGHERTIAGEKIDFPTAVVDGVIEKAYTKKAGDYAADLYDSMTERLDDYYGFLDNRQNRLVEDGYDAGATPLDLWYSGGRAEYEGEQLALELEKENPDPAAVARYTRGLEGAIDGVLDENGQIAEGAKHLTDDQLNFLRQFYRSIGSEGLANLGELGSDSAMASQAIQATQRAVANGINVLTNPEVGGLDIHQPSHFDRLPDSIASLIRDPHQVVEKRLNEQIEHYNLFDGFGDLMGHATASSGTGFSTKLAYAALWAETGLDGLHGQAGAGNIELSGASSALRSVALNDVAAAALITDDYFRERMLAASWEQPDAAGDLIRAATLSPEGAEPRDAQKQAALKLLTHFSLNGSDALSSLTDRDGEPRGAGASAIQAAVKDVSLGYLDHLTENSVEGYSYFNAGESREIRLTSVDRFELFKYLGQSESSVLNDWQTGLQTYYTTRAAEAFAPGVEAAHREGILGDIGAVDGAVHGAYNQILTDAKSDPEKRDAEVKRQQIAVATAITGVGAAVASGGVATSFGIASAAAGTAGALTESSSEAASFARDLHYNAADKDPLPLRRTVAEAALNAGYGSAAENLKSFEPHQTVVDLDNNRLTSMSDVSKEDLGDALDRVESSYSTAAKNMELDFQKYHRAPAAGE
ncbi:hypothetical protein ACFVAG_02915 [Streptomyces sp. NPDC057644]|uniref:TPR repeat region-containing protein n=1 Tax=Streptomyces sp. NPDC057644 TaxID=3346191 RepID=UPI0036C9844F